MIVKVTHDNGKHFLEVELSSKLKRKLKDYLINQFEVQEDTNKDYLLQFADDEWYIPKEKSNEMYKRIIKAYSEVIDN